MATNTKNEHEHMHCESCEMCHTDYHRYYFLRWILGILILLIVFWLGIKIGEFKGYFESEFGGFGYHRMMFDTRYGTGMMQYWLDATPPAPSSSTSKTTTPKK